MIASVQTDILDVAHVIEMNTQERMEGESVLCVCIFLAEGYKPREYRFHAEN